MDISAALTSDKKALTVAVVNPKNEAVSLKLNLNGVKLAGRAQTWVIAGSDPLAFNQLGEPRKVDVTEETPADLSGTVSVKPYSITLWRVPVQ